MKDMTIIPLDDVLINREEIIYTSVAGLNIQFFDGQMFWWRHDKPVDKEETIFMSDIYVDIRLFEWDIAKPSRSDIVISVRYLLTNNNDRTIAPHEQMVRLKDARMIDFLTTTPYQCPQVSNSRN